MKRKPEPESPLQISRDDRCKEKFEAHELYLDDICPEGKSVYDHDHDATCPIDGENP